MSRNRLLSFGFALSPWQTIPYTENRSIGHFEGDHFDPSTWKPQTPNAAYLELRGDDAFWAARRVMAFSDDLIRAAVRTGQYRDPAAELHLASVLIKRRDAIGRAYLTAINPIVEPRLDAAGTLIFENAATSAGFAARARRLSGSLVALRQHDRKHDPARREPRHDDDAGGARADCPMTLNTFVADRHRRRGLGRACMGGAGANLLPANARRLEARRPRTPPREDCRKPGWRGQAVNYE